MSVEIISMVWKSSKQKGSHLLLMAALADFSNQEGWCWPSNESLCQRTRMKRRYVQQMLLDLQKDGEITINERPGKSNYYRVHPEGGVHPSARVQQDARVHPSAGEGCSGVHPEPSGNRHGTFSKPTEDEVVEACKSKGLQEDDGKWLFSVWEGNGFTINGKAIKSWKGVLASRFYAKLFPSQKPSGKNGNNPVPPVKPMYSASDYE